MKTPANFLSVVFILMASFSIHEFYFTALNKSNYHFSLFRVARLKHVARMDSHKAEGPDTGGSRNTLPMLCPLTLTYTSPGQHDAVSHVKLWWGYGVPLLGISEQLRDSSGERGLGG